MTRVQSINAIQAGKVAGLMYFFVSLVICIPLFVVAYLFKQAFGDNEGVNALPMFIWVGAPLFYGILGFVGSALMASVYNLVARLVGGFEMTFVSEKKVVAEKTEAPLT